MGILGSAFGRALAGAGEAASSLASKYIDDEIARNRAEALADLQVKTAGRVREDADKFTNDPTRIARDRTNKRDDALATAATAREVELAGLTDPSLRGARRSVADEDAADATRRKIDAEKTELGDTSLIEARRGKARGDAVAAADTQIDVAKRMASDKEYLDGLERIKLADPEVKSRIAQAKASAAASYASAGNSNANAMQTRMQTAAAKRVDDIYAGMLRDLGDKSLSDDERKRSLAEGQAKLAVLAPAKDKDARPVETVETEYGPDGKPIGSKRTVKGPLGSDGGPADPEAQGMKLIQQALAAGKGKDLIAKMEADGLSPAKIVALVGEQEYAKAKGTRDKMSRGESGGRSETPAGALETTKKPDGSTVYRYKGQDRWYPSKVDAMNALGNKGAQTQMDGFLQM